MTTEVYHPAARSHPVPTQSFVLSLCMTRGIVDFDSLELEHDAHQRPVPVLQVEVDVELARRLQEHWPLGRAESSCAFQDAMRIYLRKRVQHTNTYSLRAAARGLDHESILSRSGRKSGRAVGVAHARRPKALGLAQTVKRSYRRYDNGVWNAE